MYQEFFGLSALPFELTPDARFLYLPGAHQEALSTLQYAVMARKGLTVLTGEAGLGKTTVLRAAISQLEGVPPRLIMVSNPALARDEFVETIARALGFSEPGRASKPAMLAALEGELQKECERGGRAVLVADEAHVMSDELLEEIRLLGNIETSTHKLLSIVLVGQRELADRLNAPSLSQLKQRVALRCSLRALTALETMAYIDTRLRVAGRSIEQVFEAEALSVIFKLSKGIPRTINVICDNALLTAFALGQRRISAHIVEEIQDDFDLGLEVEAPRPPAPAPLERVPPATELESLPLPPIVKPDMEPGPAVPRPAPRDVELFTSYKQRRGFFARVFSS